MYSFIRTMNKVFKTGMYDYCNIEANNHTDKTKTSLVTKDGALMTVVKVEGTYSLIGNKRFAENMTSCLDNLSGILKKPGYKIQFVFNRDPDGAKRLVDRSIDPAIQTLDNLHVDLQDMLSERSELMGNKTSSEACYIVLTTLPGVLDSKTYKNSLKSRIEDVAEFNIGLKSGEFGQSMNMAIPALKEIHTGFVNSIVNTMSQIVQLKPLSAHDALKSMRMEVNLDMTSDNWKASLIGDKIAPRAIQESGRKKDVSHMLNPDIGFQLFNQRPEIHESDASLIKMGNKVIAPLMVDIPSQTAKPFSELFEKINDDVPWRFSFTLETGHSQVMSKISTKNGFATFLAMFSGSNRDIKDAASELMELARGGESMIMGYMSFCTWGKDLDETNRRKQILAQAASNWGNMDIIEEFGDSISAWCDTIPGMTKRPISTPFPIPLMDAFAMLPLTRPASPWEDGTVSFRTTDNKLFPYSPGSTKQTAWCDIIFAPPGFGKSFFLAAANMALITNPGNRILPRISIIDIGFSSAAFVNLVRSSLPESQKHLAQAFKIENTKDWAINFFDTPLGCQYPLAVDKEFIVNIMSLLLTPAGSPPVPRLSEIVGKLVDEMYDYFSEENSPKIYSRDTDTEVDSALDTLGFVCEEDDEISWWQIVSYLHKKGFNSEAGLAQRYAVPTFSDTTTVLSESTNIKDNFGEAQNSGENMMKYIEGMISSVASDYPIIVGASKFDIGSARICSMDISNVAKGGSAQGNKRVGVMYMLARNVMCKEFYRNSDILHEIPEEYRDYHEALIEADAGVPKKLCMDEFHRTSACPEVRLQAIQDIREGRKFNVHIALLSQMVDDFDSEMIELSNNVFILSKGNAEDTITKIKEKFKPSSDAIKDLKKYCTGPGPEGSSMLYLGNIKGGKNVEMIVRLTLGPIERWAYSTTHEDVRLRGRLAKEIGLNNALRILGSEFPGGGAKDYMTSKQAQIDIGEDVNIIEVVKAELIDKYKHELSGVRKQVA